MTLPTRTLEGRLAAPDFALPEWAQAHLCVALWDRDSGPQQVIVRTRVSGPEGLFWLGLDEERATRLALTGQRAGPQHLVSVGWGEAFDPTLVHLPWPVDWASRGRINLAWDGTVTLIGFVEQMHLQEVGAQPLAILELAGYAVPFTYQRLPPLPVPALGDRHGLHTDRRLDDADEQAFYLLVGIESPLASAAQDALVSQLRVVATASLGRQEAYWHTLVNLPLTLDALTLIGP